MKTHIIILSIMLIACRLTAQSVQEVDSPQAHELLQTFDHHTGVLIDGRDSTMFASGHIDKAIKINAYKENLAENLTPYLTREKIMVYCTTHRRTD
ncbi:MAG: rhodanese-like domain-containing protein, partial [Bacteroidota bacterium]